MLLAAVVYGTWMAAVWGFARMPGWVILPLLVVVTAWHMSLQHELVHGHPTRSKRINRWLGLLPLGVWYPFDEYRRSHLAHHRDPLLTLPGIDPESNYLYAEDFERKPRIVQGLLHAQRSALGRFLIGPAFAIGHLAGVLVQAGTWRNASVRKSWLQHGTILAAMLAALHWLASLPVWLYLLAVAYPALGLAMMRSLYEHRPAALAEHRIVINEAGLLWRLLYLNNNYHAVHHEQPSLPWYELGAAYAARRSHYLDRNGDFLQRGYVSLLSKHALRPVDSPIFPFLRPSAPDRAKPLRARDH